MSESKILEAAIQKAIDNGWEALPLVGAEEWGEFSRAEKEYVCNNLIDIGRNKKSQGYPIIIFGHDFAKALWGEELIKIDDIITEIGNKYPYMQIAFEYRLQQMVIADDPIKYLGANL